MILEGRAGVDKKVAFEETCASIVHRELFIVIAGRSVIVITLCLGVNVPLINPS